MRKTTRQTRHFQHDDIMQAQLADLDKGHDVVWQGMTRWPNSSGMALHLSWI